MDETQMNGANYSASNIQVLEGLEAVRKRPAMYIGDISEKIPSRFRITDVVFPWICTRRSIAVPSRW